MQDTEKPLRTVRSYVLRQGRMTSAQREALDTLWGCYGVNPMNTDLDLDVLFGRCAPRAVEIGFGMGDALAAMAEAHPEQDYLGIEVHRPGVGSLLRQIEWRGLSNVRVMCADAVQVLEQQIPDNSLDAVHLFFPDPWPKRRHHKRRLVQEQFVELIAQKLKPNRVFHFATDWQEYAEQALDVMSNAPGFVNAAGAGNYSPRPDYRPLTKFERRGQRLGHEVWDLIFSKQP
ncbi:MAG: tRNA (guanosine(46)-N7)-methyltransferase TrmB [Gammaproteobacteria bacterium]|nr:tRNA (guanosine(46)-N7)-methyltransferase TrmB [Gammaproteobacteria bacterium]